jgi:hypothetical protein
MSRVGVSFLVMDEARQSSASSGVTSGSEQRAHVVASGLIDEPSRQTGDVQDGLSGLVAADGAVPFLHRPANGSFHAIAGGTDLEVFRVFQGTIAGEAFLVIPEMEEMTARAVPDARLVPFP